MQKTTALLALRYLIFLGHLDFFSDTNDCALFHGLWSNICLSFVTGGVGVISKELEAIQAI